MVINLALLVDFWYIENDSQGVNIRSDSLLTSRRTSCKHSPDYAHRTYISGIERGLRNVSLNNVEKIATALGVDVVSLLKKDVNS